jgi:NAD(P)-dependent dehydrogenase (short-subunit alcohol dehydrogenase family)
MSNLNGKIAIVTGGSGRVGGGISEGLAEAGAEVYLTARTLRKTDRTPGSTGSLEETVARIKANGGKAHPIQCDHLDDFSVREVFRGISDRHGKLDILVNAVWGGYKQRRAARNQGKDYIIPSSDDPNFVESYSYTKSGFWEQPIEQWDTMMNAGARATYVASVFAARQMVKQGSGAIVNITVIGSEGAPNVMYGAAHVVTGFLTRFMAKYLKPHGIPVVSVYPGNVFPKDLEEAERQALPSELIENSETPLFVGRAVSALTADSNLMAKTGDTFATCDLSKEYGFRDIDGSTGTDWSRM